MAVDTASGTNSAIAECGLCIALLIKAIAEVVSICAELDAMHTIQTHPRQSEAMHVTTSSLARRLHQFRHSPVAIAQWIQLIASKPGRIECPSIIRASLNNLSKLKAGEEHRQPASRYK